MMPRSINVQTTACAEQATTALLIWPAASQAGCGTTRTSAEFAGGYVFWSLHATCHVTGGAVVATQTTCEILCRFPAAREFEDWRHKHGQAYKYEVHFAENHSSSDFSQFCYTLQTEGVAPVVLRLASAQAASKPVRCRNSKVRLLATSSLTACAKRHLGPHWTVQPSKGGRPEP